MNNDFTSANPDVHFNSENQLISGRFDDVYFSTSGSEEESEHVFINGNNLKTRFVNCSEFTIAEAGFGTGLNLLKTMEEWSQHYTPGRALHYYGFEAYPLSPDILCAVHNNWPNLGEYSRLFLNEYTTTPAKTHTYHILPWNITLTLIIGDINQTVGNTSFIADAWFLDGFSPSKNPQMWSTELFRGIQLSSRSPNTTLSTYSCARAVRDGLTSAGFTVSKVPGFGKKKHMLTGKYSN